MKSRLPPILLSAAPIGLGHLRAAQPIEEQTRGKVIVASLLESESQEEKKLWSNLRQQHELFSQMTGQTFIGHFALKLLDKVQAIEPLRRGVDLSSPTWQVKLLEQIINQGLGRRLAQKAKISGLPLVTTFYALALAADQGGAKKVFCIIPDVQVSRAWVASQPQQSSIIYFVPLPETVQRLQAYGVPADHIYLTGFPLPLENVKHAAHDLQRRLQKLDPQKFSGQAQKPLNLVFAIGGAGAQADLAIKTLQYLLPAIKSGRLIFHLVAGVRPSVNQFFRKNLKDLGLNTLLDEGKIKILFEPSFSRYFQAFNRLMRETDVLFTKPSELVFFVALGLPIVATPAIGPHEEYNLAWLLKIGAAIPYDQAMANWETYLRQGKFVQAARNGFAKAPRGGTMKIFQLLKRLG